MKAIVAMDPYRVIGCKDRIPWHYPEDLKWFKAQTNDSVLVMGRRTFESVGCLPGRFTYVLTTDPKKLASHEDVNRRYIQGSELTEWCQKWPGRTSYFWLCGGARVYKEFLPLCTELFCTHIIEDYDGDTYMPEFEADFPNSKIVKETKDFWIVRYWKENPVICCCC